MALVQSSTATKYARRGLLEEDHVEHVESAGELLIKQLVQKQTNKTITLNEQLRYEQKFERGVGFVSLNELGAGSSTLKQFEQKNQEAEKVRELLSKGLSREEALSLVFNCRKSKATPESQAVLHQFLTQQNCDSPTNVRTLFGKRQEHEVGLSVKPNSLETRLYHFAVSNESAGKYPQCDEHPSDHPINQLAAIEHSLTATADPLKTAKTFRRKRRQQVEAMAEPLQVGNRPPDRKQSLWDITEIPVLNKKPKEFLQKKITCPKQTFYTIKEGEILKLDSKKLGKNNTLISHRSKPSGDVFVSLEKTLDLPDICGRLSEEEIKQLPRFENYHQGKESKTLFIKNLSHHVTESDLAAIFCPFQENCDEKVLFRLMSGKMRGQAFITFKSCSNAATALQNLNGLFLKGKPVIIQFGRRGD